MVFLGLVIDEVFIVKEFFVQVNFEIIIIYVKGPCLFDEDLSEVSINGPVSFPIGSARVDLETGLLMPE